MAAGAGMLLTVSTVLEAMYLVEQEQEQFKLINNRSDLTANSPMVGLVIEKLKVSKKPGP